MANLQIKYPLFILLFINTLGHTLVCNNLHFKDSLINLKKASDKSLSINQRILFLDSIYQYSVRIKNDSLRSEVLKHHIKLYYLQENWNLFNSSRIEHLQLAHQLKDSIALAKTLEYSGYYYDINYLVSEAYNSYYKSYKIYQSLNDSLRSGKVLLNLAIIQKETHDYVGSETTSFLALNYLKSSTNLRRISSVYNNLGLIYEQLGDKQNSIKYHTKALELRKQIIKNPTFQIHSYNNLGILHTRNKEYKKAIDYFETAISYDSVLKNDSYIKSLILDNYAYARFKNGDINVLDLFLKALKIREEKNYTNDIVINCIHLAEYFSKIEDQKQALTYAQRAESIAKSTGNFHDYLMSIELLSRLQSTKTAKDKHFKKYIAVRDSLDLVAKNYREQYARIRFETDEKEEIIKRQESEIEKKQKSTNLKVFLFTFSTISLAILVFISYRKKKQLVENNAIIQEYHKKHIDSLKRKIQVQTLNDDAKKEQLELKNIVFMEKGGKMIFGMIGKIREKIGKNSFLIYASSGNKYVKKISASDFFETFLKNTSFSRVNVSLIINLHFVKQNKENDFEVSFKQWNRENKRFENVSVLLPLAKTGKYREQFLTNFKDFNEKSNKIQ